MFGSVAGRRVILLLAALLLIFGGYAFSADLGIGYVQGSNLSGLMVTYDPVRLLSLRAVVSLLNSSASTVPQGLESYPSVSINTGSIGIEGLFNLERPSKNAKFYAGVGLEYLGINSAATTTENDFAVDILALAGFEYRPKEIFNVGLSAEIGYDLRFYGINKNAISTFPNGYLGQMFWGVGVTWYF